MFITKPPVQFSGTTSVIALAPNLFSGNTFAGNILMLSKHNTETSTQFIDATGLLKKESNINILEDQPIEKILRAFESKIDEAHFAASVPPKGSRRLKFSRFPHPGLTLISLKKA